MRQIFAFTRYSVLLAIIASILLGLALFVTGLIRTFLLIYESVTKITDTKLAKNLAITSIELADLFLIGTAMYIIGIGFYELFIGNIELPDWLVITSLDDLKDKLISVIVVVLAVNFLAQVSSWDGQTDLLPYGAAIALTIAALTAFGFVRRKKEKSTKDEPINETTQ